MNLKMMIPANARHKVISDEFLGGSNPELVALAKLLCNQVFKCKKSLLN